MNASVERNPHELSEVKAHDWDYSFPAQMDFEKQLVTDFYLRIWNAHDRDAIAEVLSSDCVFRGSLGDEKRGHDGIAEYVDKVHDGLSTYRCIIGELVSEPGSALARMTFVGTHSGDFLAFPPTGIEVSWAGCCALCHQTRTNR